MCFSGAGGDADRDHETEACQPQSGVTASRQGRQEEGHCQTWLLEDEEEMGGGGRVQVVG